MPRLGVVRRFIRNDAAATAVEFALVAPMLIGLIFSTIETGWIMVQTIMLDRALDTTIRGLRIGTHTSPTQTSVRTAVCGEAMVLADCQNALTLEFIPILNESSYPLDSARCVNRGSAITPVLRFNVGGRTETVFVRACFVVKPLTPLLGIVLAIPKDSSGDYRIMSKSGFVNEPA